MEPSLHVGSPRVDVERVASEGALQLFACGHGNRKEEACDDS